MRVDKLFMGLKPDSKLSTVPKKIIIENTNDGVSRIKRKTVIADAGRAVAELKNDVLTINGKELDSSLLHDIHAESTPRTAANVIFENFEQFFNPNSNAWADIAKGFPSKASKM